MKRREGRKLTSSNVARLADWLQKLGIRNEGLITNQHRETHPQILGEGEVDGAATITDAEKVESAVGDSYSESVDYLTSFTIFPNFPTEIRLKIWKLVTLVPRVVEIFCDGRAAPGFSKFPSRTAVPAILHGNQESRNEGLKVYTQLPSFGNWDLYGETYINYDLDILLFQTSGWAFDIFIMQTTRQAKIRSENIDTANVDTEDLPQYTDINNLTKKVALSTTQLFKIRSYRAPDANTILFPQLQEILVINSIIRKDTGREQSSLYKLHTPERVDAWTEHWRRQAVCDGLADEVAIKDFVVEGNFNSSTREAEHEEGKR
ncbi:hypothetical protein BGZ60DRAFT_565176 [Tricladium varicosporioides]|nr:hypothetical protein BGZ60DRAFT_565176 [Hymenoscyphus varicosporioides]